MHIVIFASEKESILKRCVKTAAFVAPHGQNAMFWSEARTTAAMNDALKVLGTNRRKADFQIVHQELAAHGPTIILYFLKEPYVCNTDLKNFRRSPVISRFWNPWEYSI